jgi:hypothetical protein
MGANSRIASLLLDWIPAAEIIRIAEAIRRIFDRQGTEKQKPRPITLVQKGWENRSSEEYLIRNWPRC